MYARTHIYLTLKIAGSKEPYLLFGSLFPDFHQTDALPRGFDSRISDLARFLHKEYPDLIPIAIGMTLHEYPFGVDRFMHQSYKGGPGYGFQFDDQLSEDTKIVFGCDNQMARLLNHFLVENAIEYLIVTEHPEVEEIIRKCLDNIDSERIIEALAKFYEVDKEKLKQEYELFVHQTIDYDYGDYSSIGKAWVDIMERTLNRTADPNKIGKLIEKTQGIIADSVEEFLQDCIHECKKDFNQHIRYNNAE